MTDWNTSTAFGVSAFDEVVLPGLPPIPGMLSAAEKRYLYWLASRCYGGWGEVVEVGCWLGCSTAHLAAGLVASGQQPRLDAYDRFEWSRGFAGKSDLDLSPGEDFEPHFQRNVCSLFPFVRSHRTAIDNLRWDGRPIEILFLDAPKRLREISTVLAVFGPALVPGKSLLVLQDFLHFPSYALAAVLGQIRDRLEPMHRVLDGTTCTFRVRESLADLAVAQPSTWNFQAWSRALAMTNWQAALEPLDADGREELGPGLAMLHFDRGDLAAALAELDTLAVSSPKTQLRWRRLAKTHLGERYRPLFDAVLRTP